MSRKLRRELLDLVVVDATKLYYHIRRKSSNKTQFADDMGMGRTSLYRMLDGTPVKRATVQSLADELKIPFEDLLPTEVESCSDDWSWQHPEWEIVAGALTSTVAMSNGLIMRVVKVQHRVLPGEFGRAKVYDIGGMASAVREQCRDALSRHATVCRQLGDCPHIAKNLTMTTSPDQSIWTSVDAWFESESLEEIVASEPLSTKKLHVVMSDVADAILALHQHRMVARDLHPGCILVNQEQHAMITDLELSKLLEVEGTVSKDWHRNDFGHRKFPVVSHTRKPIFILLREYFSMQRLATNWRTTPMSWSC